MGRALIILVLVSVSCSRRVPLLIPGEAYRIVPAGQANVLLPPPVANAEPPDRELRLSIGAARTSKKNCAVSAAPFGLEIRDGQWILRLPANAWWTSRGIMEVSQTLRPFLDGLTGLAQRRCVDASSAESLRRGVLDSMPARIHDSLMHGYGFPSADGIADLRPGMRLRVERVWKDDTRYLGTRREFYSVTANPSGAIRIDRTSTEGDDVAAALRHREWPRVEARVMRLHLFTNLVRAKRQRAALIAGAADGIAMAKSSAAIIANPEIGCAELKRTTGLAVCLVAEGLVSAGPEVAVTVNGASKFVPIGSQLRSVVPPKTSVIQVKRRFQGSLRPVEFTGDSVLQLPLSAGDEIAYTE